MESTPVNWEALDSLVTDFARSENLLEDSPLYSPPSSPSSPSCSSSASYRSRLLIRQIRRLIESGDVESALDLIRRHVPAVLDDHRILFRLQKQRFIELLRKGTEKDRNLAIECLRGALAPCALDAYPEAYEEFKHVLLALIFREKDQISPVANEWSEKQRFDLAGWLCSILRAFLQAYDPLFSMTLRYLISIHKVYCFRQGISSPISDLTERLLFDDRDPLATPQESLYEAPPFDEVDIQALAHAVELTRQGAVDSLRFAKGDLFQAFQVGYSLFGPHLIKNLDEHTGKESIGLVSSLPSTSGSNVCRANSAFADSLARRPVDSGLDAKFLAQISQDLGFVSSTLSSQLDVETQLLCQLYSETKDQVLARFQSKLTNDQLKLIGACMDYIGLDDDHKGSEKTNSDEMLTTMKLLFLIRIGMMFRSATY